MTQQLALDQAAILARFMEKVRVDPETGCWEWLGAVKTAAHYGDQPYGNFRNGTRVMSPHRFAYETLIGPVPDGLELDHGCRNRLCCNPYDVEPVTHKVNMERAYAVRARIPARITLPAASVLDIHNVQGGDVGMNETRKETPIADGSVGGHVAGGDSQTIHGRARVGPRPQLTALQASARKGDPILPTAPATSAPSRVSDRRADDPLVVPSADPARRDSILGGPTQPAAGRGFTFASPARSIPQTKEATGALNACGL